MPPSGSADRSEVPVGVTVNCERRLFRTPDGAIWTSSSDPYAFWTRYLQVFNWVRVVCRVIDVPEVGGRWKRVDGPGVSVWAVPTFVGPGQYARKLPAVARVSRAAVRGGGAVILRVPGPVASTLEFFLRRAGVAYALEVVGDPFDALAPGAVDHPLRPLFRRLLARQLRRVCASAVGVAYVTEYALQRRYPPTSARFTTHYSSIDLSEETFALEARPGRAPAPARVVGVGSIERLYKGFDVLIESVASCLCDGLDLRLTLVGDGRQRPRLEALARARGVASRVTFAGELPGADAVRQQLTRADLFVLPSKNDGLPRAMIEAMAVGLPCIGSSVGGIPELLPAEDLVAPGDVAALTCKIREVLGDPRRMARMSERNLRKAREFAEPVLNQRRLDFYGQVRRTQEERGAATRNP